MQRHKTINRKVRSTRGQAIIGGTALLVMITMLATGMLLLLMNLAVLSTDNHQLQCIGSEAARQMAASKWWLGMQRPEYNADEAEEQAKASINCELEALGLPHASGFQFSYDKGTTRNLEFNVVRIEFDVTGLKIAPGSMFPQFVNLHVAGTSSDSEQAVTKHALALLLFIHKEVDKNGVEHEIQRGIRVPIYNATVGGGTPLDPGLLTAGGSVGNFPNAYLKMYSKHNGVIHLQEY